MESVQTQMIIVIHPGSLYLRIGRASDVLPHTELHAVARRRKVNGNTHKDTYLPSVVSVGKDVLQEMEDCRLLISHTLQSCLQSDGRRRYATPPQQIAAFNRRATPEKLTLTSGDWVKPETDLVVGDEVLQLDPDLQFNIHYPMRRGELNIHPGVGGSLTAVLQDLQTIWDWVIVTRLNIPLKDLKHYKAVLIVPDIYNYQHLKELTTLLLEKMGFGSCFLLQDHVAATFGAGLNCACVVDCGHEKLSVSCVEDGMSHPATRVRMGFGGGDITQALHWLMTKCAFPYLNCSPHTNLPDFFLMQQLKHDICHINLDICGSKETTFTVKKPKATVEQFTIQVADECLVAPLSVFQPELLGITGPKTVTTQKRSISDCHDPNDADYLRETSRRGAKEALEAASEGGLAEAAGEEDIVVDAMLEGGPTAQGCSANLRDFVFGPDELLGLDQAILQSIDRCGSDDLKRKMYSCILVVGGGMKFSGIGTWLHNRIALQIPYMFRAEQLDIVTAPKDLDPQIVVWKGATILSCLESAQELWIFQLEWQRWNVKLLRERTLIIW